MEHVHQVKRIQRRATKMIQNGGTGLSGALSQFELVHAGKVIEKRHDSKGARQYRQA